MILPGVSGGYLLLVLGQYVPILSGIDASIQICSSNATATDILNMAVIAACGLGRTG